MSEILDIAETLRRLKRAENILLVCHKNPDGDTIGSAAALYWMLKGMGKTAALLCADPIPVRYDDMGFERFENQFQPEYTVAVDVAGIQLFGDAVSAYTRNMDLCIDHHPSNGGYADAMLLDGTAAAAAEASSRRRTPGGPCKIFAPERLVLDFLRNFEPELI